MQHKLHTNRSADIGAFVCGFAPTQDFDVLKKELEESQSKLYGYGQQIGDMLTALNWPPELLQALPTRAITPGDPGPTPHQAAIAAATGAAMTQGPVTNG
jgi:hypothetical protein